MMTYYGGDTKDELKRSASLALGDAAVTTALIFKVYDIGFENYEQAANALKDT